jgi:CubicO group peptidase (beta-lactamase class C family)
MTEQPFRRSLSKLPSSVKDRLDAAIREAVPTVAPALVISVWQGGAPCYDACAGWIEPDEQSNPVGPGTLFDLASLTKPFTATAFLRLAADGRVDLDATVVSVIPEFGANGPRGVDGGQDPLSRRSLPTPPDRAGWMVDPAGVTFRQLLTHTGGLAPWRAIFLETGPVPSPPGTAELVNADQRREAGLAAICRSSFVARPGEEVHYSDLGFMLLGESVSRVLGEPLDAAVNVLFRDRLGLDSLTYLPFRSGRPRIGVAPTSVDDDWRHRRCWAEVEDENAAGFGGIAGHAGLFATARDVARFGVTWLRDDPRLRLSAYRRAAIVDQTPGTDARRGLGWQVQPTDHIAAFGPRAYGHSGFTGTSVAVDPDRDLVVALLSNRVYAGRTHPGIQELRQVVNGVLADAF